jgi:YD repeat-containing protein
MKDALGHVTQITAYTGGGRPLTVVDPNSVTTTLTYDGRQRLLTSALVTSAATYTSSWTYDPAGNLTEVTLPDGSYHAMTYDKAHRLTKVTDNSGAYIAYTLDKLGDRTAFNEYSAGGTTKVATRTATYDALGRILKDTSAVTGKSTVYTYDGNGNVLSVGCAEPRYADRRSREQHDPDDL